MQERPKAIQRIIQSPIVSILVALGAAGIILYSGERQSWVIALLSGVIGALMLSQIKARVMFRGAYFPFLGIFMLAQAAMIPDISGVILTLVAVMCLTVLLICFNQPEATRSFFVIYLAFGTGALFERCYGLVALVMFAALILVRCFSARGLTASILGFITPAIIALPLKLTDASRIITIYSSDFIPGSSITVIAVSVIACMAGIATFLPAYGYPARSRARNMAMLGLTAGTLALPFLDSANAESYFGLVNVCMAYNVCHFLSLRRFSWIYIILIWCGLGVLIGLK